MKPYSKLLSVMATLALFAALVAPAAPVQAAGQVKRLAVTASAQAGFTRTFRWGLITAAAPASWSLFNGDDAVSTVGVQLDTNGFEDSRFAVNGTVRIHNPTRSAATLTAVSGAISPGTQRAEVRCPVGLPYRLAAGMTLECTYRTSLAGARSGSVKVTAKTRGTVAGSVASASFSFGAPTEQVNASVNVTAGGQNYGPFTAPASFTLAQPVDCASGQVSPAAEIVETGQTAATEVPVVCLDLEIYKSTQTFRDGEAWGMRGTIEVRNMGSRPSYIARVVEELDRGALPVTVECGYDFAGGAFQLDPGATLSCAFSAAIPDTGERYTLTRVTAETSHYDADGTRTVTGESAYLAGPDPLGFVE